MTRTNGNSTTIKVSRKLIEALKKDGFMGETYEDVIWRWKDKKVKEDKKSTPKDKEIGGKL